jgi:hypothetical protein
MLSPLTKESKKIGKSKETKETKQKERPPTYQTKRPWKDLTPPLAWAGTFGRQ